MTIERWPTWTIDGCMSMLVDTEGMVWLENTDIGDSLALGDTASEMSDLITVLQEVREVLVKREAEAPRA